MRIKAALPEHATKLFYRFSYVPATILVLAIIVYLHLETDQEITESTALSSGPLSLPNNPSTENLDEESSTQFVATVKEEVFTRPVQSPATPNFFEILKKKNCLPNGYECLNCLGGDRNRKRANCKKCQEVCGCFCTSLCHDKVEPKFVSKKLTVTLPSQSKDSNRLIPRIVHQTWFESMDRNKYPKMTRLMQSFRFSGWEHRFYTDAESATFLSTHFPPEVREAYDTLIPGAFKADLFRYCVLLIHGGLYADVDILLTSNLDVTVGPDVGFMAPFDEVSLRLCRFRYECYILFASDSYSHIFGILRRRTYVAR
jgi:hypothetical protein